VRAPASGTAASGAISGPLAAWRIVKPPIVTSTVAPMRARTASMIAARTGASPSL